MGFGADQLKGKALLALEEALQELRYRPVRRSIALRFALAYLWASSGGDRGPFEDYWRAAADERMWRFSTADRALIGIYAAVGVQRDDGEDGALGSSTPRGAGEGYMRLANPPAPAGANVGEIVPSGPTGRETLAKARSLEVAHSTTSGGEIYGISIFRSHTRSDRGNDREE
jgi:hypothetical protein